MDVDVAPVEAPTTSEDTPVVEAAPTTSTAEAVAPVAETPNWQQELEKTDAKTLRSHPKIAGLIGNEIQRAITTERDRIKSEEGARAAREAEERLRALAQNDPDTFAQQWLTDAQKRDIQNQLDGIRGKTRHEFAATIGRAMNDVPEWKELSEDDMTTIASKLQGKPEDEVISLFNQIAVDMLSHKRAQKLFAEWREKELPKERGVIREEEAAKLLNGKAAPNLSRPKGQGANLNVASMTDAEFEEYWNTVHKR